MTKSDKNREERRRLRNQYRDLFDTVASILFAADPIGINFESNADEYEPEVGTILPRLASCTSADDVRKIVHEEFTVWFSPHDVGPESHYDSIAQEIWSAWQQAECNSPSSQT